MHPRRGDHQPINEFWVCGSRVTVTLFLQGMIGAAPVQKPVVTPDATTLSLALSLDIWSKQPNPVATDRWKQTLTHIEGHKKGTQITGWKVHTGTRSLCLCLWNRQRHTRGYMQATHVYARDHRQTCHIPASANGAHSYVHPYSRPHTQNSKTKTTPPARTFIT